MLKAGVIGAGVFGGYHASKYSAFEDVEFRGVFDPVSDHAVALCEKHGGEPFESLGALIEACDALSIASPAVFHHDAAKRAILAGKPILVEKPLAATLSEAEELVKLADEHDIIVRIGHQERFVFQAMGVFGDLPKIMSLSARRMGTPSARNLDVSVTLDLMVHDIDLVLALMGERPVKVQSNIIAHRANLADHIRTELTFPRGATAILEASRVADDRDRVMDIEYEGATLGVDFLSKRFDNPAGLPLDPDFAESPTSKDSLGANVAAFLSAVRGGDGRPAADAKAGLLGLETALRVDEAAGGRSRL
jgi:predicted dehydrogenase